MRILDRHVKESKNARKNPLPLPYVFPLVYYNGETAYKGERCLFNLFGEHQERVMQLFNGPVNLVDISLEAGKDLRGQKRASLLSWCMRYSMEREFLSAVAEFGQYIQDLIATSVWTEADSDRSKVMLEYMIRSLSTSVDSDVLIQAVYNTLPSELEGTVATLAEQLFKEGRVEGFEETLDAISLINAGWDNEAISKKMDISVEIIEKLRKEITH